MSESLTFRLLTYVRAVAEARNFTRAAERLYLSQPSLSQQVRDLEEQLKFPLFDRKGPGIRVTDAGKLIVSYADRALRERDEIVAIARAIHLGNVPPLRLGFSSFINVGLLQFFREQYQSMFPGCEIHLAGVEPMLALQRLRERLLHCAFLPMPIDDEIFKVQQIARSALVVCMPSSDPLAGQTRVEMNQVADRLRIFEIQNSIPQHMRDWSRFQEVGVPLIIYSSARTSTDMQWLVKAGYGFALVDQLMPLEAGLVARPIAGVDWTADTAFVHQNRADHIALPFIEKFFQDHWRDAGRRKQPQTSVRPEQLKLLA